MMTQQLEVSILAAPLGAIDRRALSQAWYSALRLGRTAPPAAATVSTASRGGSSCPKQRESHPSPRLGAPPARPAGASRSHSTREPEICEDAEFRRPGVARAPRPQLAGAIERAFADAALRRATFSVGRGSARIHIVLQTKGNRTTLIALCRPHLSGVVARALAQAQVALAARGIGVDLRTRGVRPCS